MNWGTLKFQMKTLSFQTPGTCLHSTSLLPSSCLPRKCWDRQITPSPGAPPQAKRVVKPCHPLNHCTVSTLCTSVFSNGKWS